MVIDVAAIKSQFPIFGHHADLVYLDNAATSQKPSSVIRATANFYERSNANIHRGLYRLSSDASRSYESVRTQVAKLIEASDPRCIAFTKGTTESINLIASGFLKSRLQHGDNVIISALEHHANFIPWQQVCQEKECELRIAGLTAEGELDFQDFKRKLGTKTKLVAVTHVSNVLGSVNPIKKITEECHRVNVPVVVDAAQSVGHIPVSVKELDVDFLTFSAHKMFGPMGVGVLYAHSKFRNEIVPMNFGGGAIKIVTERETVFLDYPAKLEAGTPDVAGVVGFGAAPEFIQKIDLNTCHQHTVHLATTLVEKLRRLSFVEIYGKSQTGIVSFNISNIHPHDVASFLADKNIAVRAGHHCAQPLMDRLNIGATVRASFAMYNSVEDVDALVASVTDVKKFWS